MIHYRNPREINIHCECLLGPHPVLQEMYIFPIPRLSTQNTVYKLICSETCCVAQTASSCLSLLSLALSVNNRCVTNKPTAQRLKAQICPCSRLLEGLPVGRAGGWGSSLGAQASEAWLVPEAQLRSDSGPSSVLSSSQCSVQLYGVLHTDRTLLVRFISWLLRRINRVFSLLCVGTPG